MNATLLLKVKDQILNEPRLFDMGLWQEVHSCGTVCCIGGWACALEGQFSGNDEYTKRKAIELLGLTEDEARTLFYAGGWPRDLYNKYLEACDLYGRNSRECAEIAAERIDRFLAERCPNFKKGLEENVAAV